jgi:uncharacterized protein (UPF0332 family)/predicted nucleotidyltransferase
MDQLLKEFTEALKDRLKERLYKVYLFGSYAKGEAHKDSDIDILIVAKDGADAVDELSFSFQMRGLSVEPILCSQDELIFPTDYFVYNILKNGVEVYSMDEEGIRRENARGLLGLSEEYLESAINAKDNGFLRLSIDAGYNSAELSAKGLILLKSEEIPGSHTGVVSRFGELYVKPGIVGAELGRRLNRALRLRSSVRYRFTAEFSKEDAESVIELAKEMAEILRKELGDDRRKSC